jgi:hypothetical protein
MTNPTFNERATSAQLAAALDFGRYDEIAGLGERAASYWCSIALAANRGDALTVVTHCRQVAAVTREAFALVKQLGQEEPS